MFRQSIITAAILISATASQAQLASSHGKAKTTTGQSLPNASSMAAEGSMATVKPMAVKDKPVVKVNGAVLTDRDLVREMFQIFPYGQIHNGFPKELEPQIRQGALQMIIFEELVFQEAKRRDIVIPDNKIDNAIAQFRKRFPTSAAYSEYLRQETGGSPKVFRERVRRSMMIEALLRQEVTTKSLVTPAQIRAEYEKHAKDYTHGELFHIQSISIMPPNGSPDNVKEAKRRAEEVLQKAKKAKTFQEFGLLAEKYSDDDFHVNMGDHHETEARELPPPVVEEAKKMKAGQVSDLIQLGNFYTIFRLDSYQSAGVKPLKDVQEKLKSEMERANEERLRSALGEKLRKNAKVEVL